MAAAVQVTLARQFGSNLAQRHGGRACAVQLLGQRHSRRRDLGMRLSATALADLGLLQFASAAQPRDQPCLLVLRKGTGNLGYAFPVSGQSNDKGDKVSSPSMANPVARRTSDPFGSGVR